ncbi:ATP-binding cassette domain-containing protein [Segetibacter aerophilus]|uniref:ABC transporter ATP-binding protein n=1 Tax=Segetibacter aerophilus TaxID=670293 RepID=A0A512BG34_9BACT|nr:ATP-binding cassette domain-containing protein [Segetibacter aerophilus]GEO10921.1 ABC transporter ATP-binding protein [Segetibacter aerophilus]
MEIQLQQLVPIPLKEKFSQRPSNIWNTGIAFRAGDWIKIVAPSGTGKTTLMNILYKVRHDYEGSVKWDNRDLKSITGDDLAKLRQQNVSVIFQDLRLFENLTARENIELNRVLQKPFYEAATIDDMAGLLGISHILEQRAGVCSYGEQQRIAIIRALVQPFEWLIMDEPFSHLDNANTHKAADLIATECKKRKAGFVLTDLDEDSLFPYTHVYSL